MLRFAASRSGRDLPLSVQLDESGGAHIWGETHRLPHKALAETLGALAHRVTSRMLLETARQGAALPFADRSAVHLLAQGLGGVHAAGRNDVAAAIICLDAALTVDPGLAVARAYRAEARVLEAAFGSDPDPDAAVVEAVMDDARLAVAAAPDEARCHRVLSFLLGWRGDLDGAELAARQSVRLNPWDADCIAHLGVIVTQRGDPAEGLRLMEAAADLNPLHPQWFHHQFALAHYLLGNPAAALGDVTRVRRHLGSARAIAPGFDPIAAVGEIYGFERPDDKARLLADVARAVAMER